MFFKVFHIKEIQYISIHEIMTNCALILKKVYVWFDFHIRSLGIHWEHHQLKVFRYMEKKNVFSLFRKFQDATLIQRYVWYIVSHIVNYGMGISLILWGSNSSLIFLKRILECKKSTSNYMVYFELGKVPLYIHWYCKMMKCWCKLLKTDNCIYKLVIQNCWKMLKSKNKLNWSCI